MKRPHNATLRSALPLDNHLLSDCPHSPNFAANTTKFKMATPHEQKILSAIEEVRNGADEAEAAENNVSKRKGFRPEAGTRSRRCGHQS